MSHAAIPSTRSSSISHKSDKAKNPAASTAAHVTDETSRVQAVERGLPASVALLEPSQRVDKHAVVRRSSPQQTNLLLAEADESGGDVAGIAIDVAALRADLTRAARLRVGSASAHRVAQRMSDAALTLESSVAQRVLVAVGALEAKSRAPEGIGLVGKVANLRAAARRVRKSRGKNAGSAPTAPSVGATSATPASSSAPAGATRA